MKLFLKVMEVLYKGLPPYRRNAAWEPKAKEDLTRVPMYGDALPLTTCHF